MINYNVQGMDCADCATKIQTGVAKLPGARNVTVDFMTGKLSLDGVVERTALQQRIETLGYGLIDETQDAVPSELRKTPGGPIGFLSYLWRENDTRLALIGGGLIVFSILCTLLGMTGVLLQALLVGAMAVAAFPAAKRGVNTLRINREFSIDLLMVIAAVGAILIGEPLEGATVVFLYAIGEALEGYTVERARSSLRSLIALTPAMATRLNGTREETVPVSTLRIGDVLYVKPGERIPADGMITTGESEVDQASITGESVPVYKTVGSEVYAGTINGMGALQLGVRHIAADSTLSRIIKLVEEAQSERAPTQRLIDRVAQVYTPFIVIAAALVATIPPVLFKAPFLNTVAEQGWLYRALSLLVIACPCALVISAPVTILSAITAAARRGVLIKGGAHLEALGQVRTIAFDKTGTLTHGKPVITQVRATDCEQGTDCERCDEVLALAAAVERGSTHPLANAVIVKATARGLINQGHSVVSIESMAGRGVRGVVDGRLITVGSHTYFDEHFPHDSAFHQLVNAAEAEGQSTLLVNDGERVRGYLAAADSPRQESATVVQALHEAGIYTVMLTGDHAASARRIAGLVGINETQAGLLPDQKLSAIRKLTDERGPVAMVGDGINDTPALAAAQVGIAMGGAGSAQAIETADVVLMADSLTQLPFAVRLARFARRLIGQNIVISFGTKAVFLILAVEGSGSLWLAIAADVGVSLVVTLNGMRAMRATD